MTTTLQGGKILKSIVQEWFGQKSKKTDSLPSRSEFDKIIGAYAPELRRFVLSKVGPEAADDVLQEVWLAAWQALPTYDGKSKLRTWIYGICLHKCHDYYRVQRRNEEFVALGDSYLLAVSHSSPEGALVQSETVRHLLGELDEAQRRVLELYYYAQLTLAEIAAILGMNTNTVKYQFYRAHATMLAYGEKEGLR